MVIVRISLQEEMVEFSNLNDFLVIIVVWKCSKFPTLFLDFQLWKPDIFPPQPDDTLVSIICNTGKKSKATFDYAFHWESIGGQFCLSWGETLGSKLHRVARNIPVLSLSKI